MIPESAKKYAAPRDYPLSYPGKRPSYGFILANGVIWPVAFDKRKKEIHDAKVIINSSGEFLTINKFLESKQVSILEKRYAILGYGSNPVPGQLLSKFGKEAIVPVIFGSLKNCDAVYNLISNVGYAFAEMSINEDFTEGSIAITFLDKYQLHMMIETEKNYHLAYSHSDVILESGEKLSGGEGNSLYMFAGFRKLWVPLNYDGPIPIAELPSSGRKRKALTQTETLKLVIEEFKLNKGVLEN